MKPRTILVSYYAATALFLLLDYALSINVRLAYLEPHAGLRAGYYGVCFLCLALMLWQPAWTVLISTVESLVTLIALIFTMALRTMLVSDQVLRTGQGIVTLPEIINFLLAGGAAYVAWTRGLQSLRGSSRPPW